MLQALLIDSPLLKFSATESLGVPPRSLEHYPSKLQGLGVQGLGFRV